jgi:aryl-alcohol dehydrogenase-like predicted oxidoreductase
VLKDRRKNVVYATKWGGREPGGKPAVIRASLEGSLRRLQTDYIDLYQLHVPDPATPIGETLLALNALKKEGKIRHFGASNFNAAQLDEADRAATDAERDVLPACARLNVGFIPYFPLASGLLTGKYRRNQPAPEGTRLANRPIDAGTYDKIEKLEAFARERGHTLLDLAVAGLAAWPQVATVIAGATRPEQVRENAAAAAWQLSPADAAELRKLTAAM